MSRGAVHGALGGALGLIALQVLTTQHGSWAAGGVISWADSVVTRALDPNVPAIPDFRVPRPAAPTGIGGAVGAAARSAVTAGRQATTGSPYDPTSRLPVPGVAVPQ